jgi:regulatory protein
VSEDVKKTRRIALDLLAVCDRTVREMGDRLVRRKCSQDAIRVVVADLCRTGLLDDHTFVRRWVGGRLERRPEGWIKLIQDLCKKGIERSVAEQVLAEFEDDIGTGDAADRVLTRVLHKYSKLEPDAARRRMYGLLARRGFDPDTAGAAVERALVESEDTTAPC